MKTACLFSLDGLSNEAQQHLENLISSFGVLCFVYNSTLNVSCTKCERIMIEDIVNATVTLNKLCK